MFLFEGKKINGHVRYAIKCFSLNYLKKLVGGKE